MTLSVSGPLSFSDINTELGLSSTAQISMNDNAVRVLFGALSGAISMTDGYGKSNGPPPDTFTVANINIGTSYYGAFNYTTGFTNINTGDFGTVTSDYLYAIYSYTFDSGNTYYSDIMLNPGTYSGFSVTNAYIDSDVDGYPRIFTIGGINYTFFFSAIDQRYVKRGDPINLVSSVGSTISAVYNPAIQVSVPSGSIYVDSYTDFSGTTHYGASIENTLVGYSFVNTDYIRSIDYYDQGFMSSTIIRLVPGTYTGFVVDSEGAIDSTSTSKVFTIDGTNATFTRGGSAPEYTYVNQGNPYSLNTKVNQVITAVYDPAQNTGGGGGGGATAFTTGTITVGFNGFDTYGWSSFQYGSSSFNPPTDPVIVIKFDSAYMPSGQTQISLISGTYNGVVIDNSTYTVDGESTITVTIDGVSAELTLAGSLTATVAGDPFSLQAKNGQTLAVSMVAGVVVPPSNEVATGNLTVGFNGSNRYGYIPAWFGSFTISPNMVDALYYYSMSNDTTIQFISGTYGSVVVSSSPATIDGETSVTVTIDGVSQTGTLMSGGMGPSLLISGDPFSLQSKNGQTLAVAVVAGAGGGGGTTYTSMGNWTSSGFNNFGPNWQVTFGLSGGVNSALLSSLNALTAGSTFSITDSGNTTVSVTVQSTSGQPWMSGSAVSITVNSPPGGTMSMPSIASITI